MKKRETRDNVIAHAQSLDYEIIQDVKTDTYTLITLEKVIIIDHDKVGEITIEQTRYTEDNLTDEYIYPDIHDCPLFPRDARELAQELINAADIAERLDKLYRK